MAILCLPCPECHRAYAIECEAWGTYDHFEVVLLSQACTCDVAGSWEDVWEQARDVVCEDGPPMTEEEADDA
jgi:hypothetical protein